jgi:hypothetical protein
VGDTNQGRVIKPEIEETVKDIQDGKDVVLEKAIVYLNN